MSQLHDLYHSIQTLKDLSLPIPADLRAAIRHKEEEIINTEILPAITECIGAILEGINREIVLEARHTPGEPLSVRFTKWSEIQFGSSEAPVNGIKISDPMELPC